MVGKKLSSYQDGWNLRKIFGIDLTKNIVQLNNAFCINTTKRTHIIPRKHSIADTATAMRYRVQIRLVKPNCLTGRKKVTTGNGLCMPCWDKACGAISANAPEDRVPFGM